MNTEALYHAWEWLLSLSKVQLIILGGTVSFLVAISKILRFLFLLGLLVVFVLVLLPEITKRYENSFLPAVVKEFVRRGVEATQDPPAPESASNKQK